MKEEINPGHKILYTLKGAYPKAMSKGAIQNATGLFWYNLVNALEELKSKGEIEEILTSETSVYRIIKK